jgi:3-methylcrotonyl-CoA carboxylase alpha subunit
VRNDVGVEAGSDISPHYDPILAKLIVHAETRREAVSRLESALDEYGVLGVTTNQGFLRWVVATPAFRDGQFDTGFVEREWRPQESRLPTEVLLLAVALEVGGSATTRQERSNPWKGSGGWRIGGSARQYRYRWQGETVVVEAQRDPGGTWTIRRDEEVVRDVVIPAPGQGRISVIAGARVTSGFALEANAQLDISWQGSVYRLDRASIAGAAGGRVMGGGRESLLAPMPGTVIRVLAKPGTAVSAHEPLVVMEAMKMEHVIEAPYAGVVREVLYGEGDMVPAGSPLVRLEGHA